MKQTLKSWLPLAVGLTALAGTLCVVTQQIHRQLADDPQLQIAQEIGEILAQGQDPSVLDQQPKVDISKSLAPFIAVFDNDSKLISSTGQINEQAPNIPKSVIETAKSGGIHSVTWQPQEDVRTALVITKYEGENPGYAVVGKSMRENDKRAKALQIPVAIGWAASLLASLIAAMLLQRKKRSLHHDTTEAASTAHHPTTHKSHETEAR